MTGEAWLLIAAGLAVGGGMAGIIRAIGWHEGYEAASHKAMMANLDELRRVAERQLDPIEHFPAGWPDKTVMN